jgi:hypothetical protein
MEKEHILEGLVEQDIVGEGTSLWCYGSLKYCENIFCGQMEKENCS